MSANHTHPPYSVSIDQHIIDPNAHAYPTIGNLPTDILVLADLHLALHLTEGPMK